MIPHDDIRDVLNESGIGSDVTVYGWVRTARMGKNVAFASISDGSCQENLQVVLNRKSFDDDSLKGLATGAAVRVCGTVVESPGREQPREVHAEELEIIGPAPEDYPLQKKKHTMEFLRTIPHLRLRSGIFGAVFRMRHHLSIAIHRFFDERGFFYVHPPLITASDAEGAGETFQVTSLPLDAVPKRDGEVDYEQDYFRRKAFLSVSVQLETEPLALALGKVYTFGPTFRADPSDTRWHASEFWMIEPEMAFYDLSDSMELIEQFIGFIASYMLDRCRDEIAFLDERVDADVRDRYRMLTEEPFVRASYTEAVERLTEASNRFETRPRWGGGFSSEHERYLAGEVYGGPVFVTDYPAQAKPFYMRLNDDGKTAACTDLLFPEVGEIVGGSQREERLDLLQERIESMGIDREDYRWYVETRRWGTAPHSGFGLGFERLLMYLTGIDNIRDVIPFPRTLGRMV
ncbi:asparagine--tRNA ligase [Candidatus Fermentibacteria bacterium]|nr:asparagine--tRNA ligase [Candidatus Fermentibacteria bacterium]